MRRGVAVCALLALTLGGCGSTSLSTQDLRNRATHLCANARARTNRIPVPASGAGGAAFVEEGIAVLDPELKGLRLLRPPHDLARVYSTSINAFAQKLEALHSAARSLASGGDPVIAMKTLQERLGPLEAAEDGAWQALEIPACLNH